LKVIQSIQIVVLKILSHVLRTQGSHIWATAPARLGVRLPMTPLNHGRFTS
jgi:hypothetical protein